MAILNYLLLTFSGAIARSRAYFGQGTVPILLDDLRCTNTESRLIDCPYTAIDNCVHSEDAGVTCTTSNELTNDTCLHTWVMQDVENEVAVHIYMLKVSLVPSLSVGRGLPRAWVRG